MALALYNWGRVVHRRGDYKRAQELHQAALSIRREMENEYLMGISLFYLGKAQLAQGEFDDAELNFIDALKAVKDSDNVHLQL